MAVVISSPVRENSRKLAEDGTTLDQLMKICSRGGETRSHWCSSVINILVAMACVSDLKGTTEFTAQTHFIDFELLDAVNRQSITHCLTTRGLHFLFGFSHISMSWR